MNTVTTKEGLIAHNVNKFPDNDDYTYYSLSELDNDDFEHLHETGFVEVWYWYGTAPYEGTGHLLGRNADGQWSDISMGHCSCYGPVEACGADKWHNSLTAIKDLYLTVEALAEVTDLLAAIEGKEE